MARAVEASLLWPGGQQGQANHSSERQHQLRPECQQWQGPQALARGKTSATRSPTEANPHALEPRSKPAAARRPTVARPASPGNGQAVCGPKAGTSKPACPRAQRQAHCGPKTNNGKPAEPPPPTTTTTTTLKRGQANCGGPQFGASRRCDCCHRRSLNSSRSGWRISTPPRSWPSLADHDWWFRQLSTSMVGMLGGHNWPLLGNRAARPAAWIAERRPRAA